MVESRMYPVKDAGTLSEMQEAFLAKIEKNRSAGLEAFKNGEFKPYQGVSAEKMAEPFYFAMLMNSESAEQIDEIVVTPLEELAQKHKIKAIFTGKGDLPPHVSLDAGNFYDIPKEQEEVIRQWLNSGSSHLNALKPILSGLSFHMDTLVVAPNSYICPSKFDNEQGAPYRARMIFEEVLLRAPKAVGKKYHEKIEGKVSLPPGYRYDDIFHLSVSRIVKKTGDENFLEFAKEANETVGRNLHENPLIITSDEVILGRPIELYQRFAPHLLNE